MHALHSNLLPSSAIHHSLFLPNFTPSTIYPLPRPPNADDTSAIKVVGNLVVAGGEDLRVFEIREQSLPVQEEEEANRARVVNGVNGNAVNGDAEVVEEDFFDNGPSEVSSYAMP